MSEKVERLKFLDQLIYKITQTGLVPFNINAAMILNPKDSKYRVTPRSLAAHIAARLEDTPLLRKKIIQDPLGLGDLRLIDDPSFDFRNQITVARLAAPGDEASLLRHLAKFTVQPLPGERPPWQFEIISGLEGGKFALAIKFSHATLDGVAAMRLFQSVMDPEPRRPEKPRRKTWQSAPEPAPVNLLAAAVIETADRLYVRTPRWLLTRSGPVLRLARKALASNILGRATGHAKAAKPASKLRATSLNQPVSTDRRILAFRHFELETLRKISRSHECTINDVCLLMASAALENYFAGIGETIDFDLHLGQPLTTRAAEDDSAGNQGRLAIINLHNTVLPLPDRLKAIREQTRAAKTARASSVDPLLGDVSLDDIWEALGLMSPMVLDAACAVLNNVEAWKRRPLMGHAVFTNVPGPRDAAYIASMPIELSIPIVPTFSTCALSMCATSLGGTLAFGFHGCGRVIEESNVQLLTDGLDKAFRELAQLDAPPAKAAQAAPRKRGTRRSAHRAK